MPCLRLPGGRLTSDGAEMLEYAAGFYSDLFGAEPCCPETRADLLEGVPRLSAAEKEGLDGELTLDELTVAVRQMAPGKTPGIDGLSTDFYQHFWDVIGADVHEFLMDSYRGGTLPVSWDDMARVAETLSVYEAASSAKVNWGKSEAILAGGWRDRDIPQLPGGLSVAVYLVACWRMASGATPPPSIRHGVRIVPPDNGVSMEDILLAVGEQSDRSIEQPYNFKGDQRSSVKRVDQQSSEPPSGPSVQQHQTQLDSIFQLLEDNIVMFVKNELKKIQRVLSPDYPESLENLLEDEDEEQRRTREAFVKITVNFLRRMKQEELAEHLQSNVSAAVCQKRLKSKLKEKYQCVFEGVVKAGNPTLLQQIYTELYITEGGTGEVNHEDEVTQIEAASRRPDRAGTTIKSTSVDVLLTNLIRGNLLPSAHLWITTRPAAANQIPPECVSMVTEVRGFTNPQKEEYFRKRFRDEEKTSRIISHIKTSRSLHIMCHIPVFCWITATVLETVLETREGGALPNTLTEMYIHFLVVQTKLKTVKYDRGVETDPHWSPESRKMMESLGKLAFEQLQKGNLIFYESDLRECGIDIREASVYSGVFTQIFKEEKHLYQHKVFCFIHLSVQEFLAALHVHQTFINSGVNLLEQQKNIFRWFKTREETLLYQTAVDKALHSPNGHLDLFLRFLLGLSLKTNQTLLRDLLKPKQGSSLNNQETVGYIKKKISEDLSAEKSINLFHCLNELNEGSLVEEVQQFLRSGRLSTDKLSPAQWSALGFILLSSEEDLEVFDLKKYSDSEEVLLRLLPVVKASKKVLLSGS
ncbi:uncharacterized protein FYW49_020396 [Xenentodon cancila]